METIPPKAKSKMSRKILKWVKRRLRIKVFFITAKNNYCMERNRPKDILGDLINPMLPAIGCSLKKPMGELHIVLKSLSMNLIIQIET